MNFPTQYSKIINRIESINPNEYAKTRNHLNGMVTFLSPYLTRGVITLSQVRDVVLQKYSEKESEKLIQELAWREYFQKVYQEKGDEIFSDLRFPQTKINNIFLSDSIVKAATGITILDTAISDLYETGYMHNHARMWVASMATNIAGSAWLKPSRWMYYHLLDGDLASNSLSWQWVCGAFSSKQYVAHQELINACSPSDQSQTGTFLDIPRDQLLGMDIPEVLEKNSELELPVFLPESDDIKVLNKNLVIYHPWCLDPNYRNIEVADKVVIIEPSHFQKYPISEKVMNFIIKIAKDNISDITIFVGEFSDLVKNYDGEVFYQYHKNVEHFSGHKDIQVELFPDVKGYYKNFFSFWKSCQKSIR
ncbi:MAG: deoxyribodipyrimidine photo-lyase [Crocinitomicaceae bacterium]|jgi:deoxyribodipyrimidine photo-lyase